MRCVWLGIIHAHVPPAPQVIIMGLIIGSMFWNLQPSQNAAREFFGVSFLSIMFIAFGSMPQAQFIFQTKRSGPRHVVADTRAL